MANRIFIDVRPVRESREFRLLFVGQMINMLGNQLVVVAIPFQVYGLTHSSLQVGIVSLVQLVPLVVGALVGGSVADALGRRPVMMATAGAVALASGALAVNACLAHPALPVIYVASALAAGMGGAYSTACTATTASLVAPDQLLAAFATLQVVDQIGMVAGPALSGVLLELIHLQWVFAIDAASSIALVISVASLAALPPAPGDPDAPRPSIREGFRLIRRDHVLLGAYLIDLNAMVFGAPNALFPALNHAAFGGGPGTLGLLYAAPGAGAFVGALTTGWLERIRRQGAAVIGAVCVWGAAIAVFGLVRTLWVALVLLALAGWADVLSAVLRTTLLQTHASAAFRGRVASVQMAVVEGGPRLGGFESGALAAATSAAISVVAGGLVAATGALLVGVTFPGFRRYRRPGGGDQDTNET